MKSLGWDLKIRHFLENTKQLGPATEKQRQLGFCCLWFGVILDRRNLLSSTGFVGRISYTLTLEELPLSDCSRFWPSDISAYEKFKLLSVTGGIQNYLEEINPKLSAEDNIKRLCFTHGGFLVEEFEQIFSDIFYVIANFTKKLPKHYVPEER